MEEKLISQKKPFFPITPELTTYLKQYNRWVFTPVFYEDLLRFSGSIVVYDENDDDTLWVRVYYSDSERVDIDYNLKKVYALLHSDGNESSIAYLNVDAIDYCTFGNSKPFRIKIRNILNDNFTYFYVKRTDASRVYGLEFEHMLSPHNLNFLVNDTTLIEEHIAGIPGDVFIEDFLGDCTPAQQAQIAKEYVKFNERCMIRLLGDMRAYNYVIIPTHDFDQVVYKIRAIDFDQQSYEGKLKVYRPQFFKENFPMVSIVKDKLTLGSVNQYKIEERSIVAKRIISAGTRLDNLVTIMKQDTLSQPSYLRNLSEEIYKFTKDEAFIDVKSMGDVMDASLNYVRRHYENLNMTKLIQSS
ncbi:hypothetical protein N9Q60_00805 [Flavobacteriaceae bacterium]|nr:hypothetical protein [Flavobacteriaceae bacterium]MDA9184007.1 hypothetical protein [Flavobacteriaceae bacterium]MDA9330554.1 hypothetical protein [Flavobacteriaceae bacterium]MDA9886885.1 hypothetical protein [Flavobacteriaceae bacterium]MDA9984823.1 hypothetical protein [Flavobacteriaceae bacterium]